MGKVLLRDVGERTKVLLLANWRVFMIYGLISFFLALVPLLVIRLVPGENLQRINGVVGLCNLYVMTFWNISITRFVVFRCRGAESFMPKHRLKVFFRYIGNGFLILFTSLACGALGALPFYAASMAGMFANPNPSIWVVLVMVGCGLLAGMAALFPILRLSPLLYAVSAEDPYDFTRIYSMTKGYTWRLYLLLLIWIVPAIFMGILLGLGAAIWQNPMGQQVALTFFGSFMGVIAYAFYGVLYNDLRMQSDTMRSPAPSDGVTGPSSKSSDG